MILIFCHLTGVLYMFIDHIILSLLPLLPCQYYTFTAKIRRREIPGTINPSFGDKICMYEFSFPQGLIYTKNFHAYKTLRSSGKFYDARDSCKLGCCALWCVFVLVARSIFYLCSTLVSLEGFQCSLGFMLFDCEFLRIFSGKKNERF